MSLRSRLSNAASYIERAIDGDVNRSYLAAAMDEIRKAIEDEVQELKNEIEHLRSQLRR